MCLMSERERLLEPNVGHFLFQFFGWFLANPWFVVDVFQRVLKCHHLAGQFRNCVCLPCCAKSIGRVIIKCGYFLACFSGNRRQYTWQPHHLLDWSMVSENWQQKWPHFMGNKQNTTLWCHHSIIELVAYYRGCILRGSRLASIELAKLFDFYDDWKRTALYCVTLFQFTFRVIAENSLCA